MSRACLYGHMDIIDLMIAKGACDWNACLIGACQRGDIKIAKFMIANGADDWNEGLASACLFIKLNIIELMIANGATTCANCNRTMADHLHPDFSSNPESDTDD